MNAEQFENVLSTETVTSVIPDGADAVPAVVATQEAPSEPTSKRIYTKKEDMTRGNEAVLATLLPFGEGEGLSKAKILAALSEGDRALVEHNWNLRISLLEETEQVRTSGKKVAKRYWRAV
jgi:hypothetical protein